MGKVKGKRIRIILLDARYFRDRQIKGPNGYLPNSDGTILGNTQWLWLEDILVKKDADLYIIGSGIQVLPRQHKFEKWANFPFERNRLLTLLDSLGIQPCILLSGDRHIAEISQSQGSKNHVPIYEVTSSGLTHSWEEFECELNDVRVSPLITQRNIGCINI